MEDPWGPEEGKVDQTQAEIGGVELAQKTRCRSGPRPSPEELPLPLGYGTPSLKSLCLGCLGRYISDILGYGEQILPFLPPDVRACLLAIAKRKVVLKDEHLGLFLDSSWDRLDLSKCSELSPEALARAAESLPRVVYLDLDGCRVTRAVLEAFAHNCSNVAVLRIGGQFCDGGKLLPALASSLPKPFSATDTAEDSWEEILQEEGSCGRWSALEFLLWEGVPRCVRELVGAQCPKVVVVGSDEDASCIHCSKSPHAPLLCWPFDAENMKMAGSEAWEERIGDSGVFRIGRGLSAFPVERGSVGASEEKVVHIAEKFRMAYEEIDTRRALKAERNYQQKRRREARRSAAGQALAKWLDAE
eukprot:evm.model.scf_688.5 EVM.evm.TU.scf_688.5   scf_688:24393-25472(+)